MPDKQSENLQDAQPARALGSVKLDVFQCIVEQAPDAVIFIDSGGAVRIWNRSAEIIFGYSAAEILGNSPDFIIPEQLRHAHWEGFRKAMDTGRTKYAGRVLTTRSVHKNGNRLYVDLSFSLVRDDTGDLIGALAIGRECTARYLSDNMLRARVARLERSCGQSSHTGDEFKTIG
jgi:PAS domain S-box-containing protein